MSTKYEQIRNLIEFIRQSGMHFDCRQVIENTQSILDRAGIISRFNPSEFEIVQKELMTMADERAANEIVYLLQSHPIPVFIALKVISQTKLEPHVLTTEISTSQRR